MRNLQKTAIKLLDGVFLLRDEPDTSDGPNWKFRRKLIFGSYRLAFAMIIFGAFTFLVDQWGVGVALITGGVSLISIITTAYTASATWQDTRINTNHNEEIDV
jgi:hypothetical protein